MNRSAADFLAYIESLNAEECLARGQTTARSNGISGIRIWFSELNGLTQSCEPDRQEHISTKVEDECQKGFKFFGWCYLLRKCLDKVQSIFKRLLEKWKHN